MCNLQEDVRLLALDNVRARPKYEALENRQHYVKNWYHLRTIGGISDPFL